MKQFPGESITVSCMMMHLWQLYFCTFQIISGPQHKLPNTAKSAITINWFLISDCFTQLCFRSYNHPTKYKQCFAVSYPFLGQLWIFIIIHSGRKQHICSRQKPTSPFGLYLKDFTFPLPTEGNFSPLYLCADYTPSVNHEDNVTSTTWHRGNKQWGGKGQRDFYTHSIREG